MIEKYGPLIVRKPFVSQTGIVVGKIESGHIVKQVDSRGNREEVMYSVNSGRTFITGFLKNSRTYHISSVTNTAGAAAGVRDLPQILHVMEEDLRGEGVKRLTTSCIVKLVPLAVRRYGFRAEKELSNEKLRRIANGRLRMRAIALYKDIDSR